MSHSGDGVQIPNLQNSDPQNITPLESLESEIPIGQSSTPVLNNPSWLQLIPSLNGKNCAEFFEALECTAQLAQWSEKHKLGITQLKLEGPARRFFKNTASKCSTYKALKEAFFEHFTTESFAKNFSTLTTAIQGQTESVRDFAARLEGLADQILDFKGAGACAAPPPFKEQVLFSQFTTGLLPNIRSQVMLLNPTTFKAAIEIAIRAELSLEIVNPNINAIRQAQSSQINMPSNNVDPYFKSIDLLTKQLQSLEVKIAKLTENDKTPQSNKVVQCTYCGYKNHQVNECRIKRRNEGRNYNNRNRQNFYRPAQPFQGQFPEQYRENSYHPPQNFQSPPSHFPSYQQNWQNSQMSRQNRSNHPN